MSEVYVEDRDFKDGDEKKADSQPKKNKTTADDRSEKGTNSEAEEASEDSFPASDPPSF